MERKGFRMKTNRSNRGFASMDAQKQREIASKGGRAAHAKGTAHEFSPEEARQAGRKGGERVSADRRHMAEIGRLGGKRSTGRRRARSDAGKSPDAAESTGTSRSAYAPSPPAM